MREKKDNKNSNGNGRMLWKPGNMVYPVPAVMVTAADREGKSVRIVDVAPFIPPGPEPGFPGPC